MKRKLLFLAMVSLLFSSCLKDGLNDFEALQHPMHLNGTINPTLGIPIGEGSANIYDLLNMFQAIQANVLISDNGLINFVYSDSNVHYHIDMEDSKGQGSKSGDIVYISKKLINGETEIDLFDNITEELNGADIDVDSILVDFGAFVQATAKEGTDTLLEHYHVHIYYDSITITTVGENNLATRVIDMEDSIPVNNLLEGEYITLLEGGDLSSIINDRPNKVQYTARLNIAFEAAFFATAGVSTDQFVADSLGITAVDIDADINVRFPLSAKISNLEYTTDIDFAPNFNMEELTIDSSILFLECNNNIPLEILLDGSLLDSNDVKICDLLDPVQTTLAAAEVTFDPTSNYYCSSNPSNTVIKIVVNRNVYDALQSAKKLHLHGVLNTASTGNPARPCVAIKSTDYLEMRVYAKIKPEYTIDIPLFGNTDQKGGAQ